MGLKNTKGKSTMQMFINNNSRFCSLCIRKYHPQTFLDECKYLQEKIKTKNYIDQDLKSESDNDNDTDTDTDNDEQIYKKSKSDNHEYILTQQSLIVYVNHALLGFYFCQSV